jgi:hypothetical protein
MIGVGGMGWKGGTGGMVGRGGIILPLLPFLRLQP